MKTFIILAVFLAAATAAPQPDVSASVVSYNFNNIGTDGFDYSVQTSDGTSKQEQGVLKNVGTENEALEVRGSYSYVGDDGQQYSVNYVADENGFRPEADHIPR